MEFKYMPIKYNYSSRKGSNIRFIVIHDTGNSGRGADALAHHRYFGGGNRNASAHYFVDDKRIVQMIGDSLSAWHCGDTWAKKRATRRDVSNRNSIGIEMCINADGNYDGMYKHTVELVKNLMKKFNIPADHVVRHFDATGKICPGHMQTGGWNRWAKFKRDIKEPMTLKIDLSKNSVAICMFQSAEVSKRQDAVRQDPAKKYQVAPVEDEKMKAIERQFEHYEEQVKNMTPPEWAKEDWDEATRDGITDGSSPNRYATRAELVVMLKRFEKALQKRLGEKHCKCNNIETGL